VLVGPFSRDDGCTRAAKDAWEHFINLRDSRPAELLAKFFDARLRGEKGVSDEVLVNLLVQLLALQTTDSTCFNC
jgi:cullin 4